MDDYSSDEGPVPERKSWPNLVGSDAARAQAIVRSQGNYYIVLDDYKATRKVQEAKAFNPWRVIIYLDKDGYVAITPRVG